MSCGYLSDHRPDMADETIVWFLAIACPCTPYGQRCAMRFEFYLHEVRGKYTKHLVSIRISAHSDKMRIANTPN